MSSNQQKIQRSLKSAIVSSVVIAFTILGTIVVRAVLDRLFDGRWNTNWSVAIEIALVISSAWFICIFLYAYLTSVSSSQVEAILDQEPSYTNRHEAPLTGFVAMEYYAMMLNRTYVVFIAAEGLYGWKATGAVTGALPNYFQPYADLLDDPEMMQDREAIKKLSELKGGFFIPRLSIVSAEIVDKQKWGMGLIPHCGRIQIGLSNGKSREFILLGSVYPQSIRDSILNATTAGGHPQPV